MKQRLKREQFTIQIHPPVARNALQCININENGDFNLIPSEKDTDAIRFPKSGRKRIPDVTELLYKKKIPLPVQYEVWFNQEENFWQGDLAENPTKDQPQGQQKPSPKSKRN